VKSPIGLSILWHFHQPEYTDPATGAPTMPWTRLHALKDYADMADHLARHPGVRATINVVPSLIDQLEVLAAPDSRPDPFLEIARKRADTLTEEDKRFLVTHFFSFNRDTLARGLRRVHELFALRGEYGSDPVPKTAVDRFDVDALRDLQVLFHLAWSGPLLQKDATVAELRAKGKRFTEEDKHQLLDVQQAFVADVVPRWRRLAEAGHVEFSVSAYYHPILPLLCDLESAHEALPGMKLPPLPFREPADARLQITEGIRRFERALGRKPLGGWPPEGAISEAALALLGETGYRWAASDEEVLLASLGERLPADKNAAELRRASLLYRPWRAGNGPVLLFRDHELSDRIGFVYSAWRPTVAAEDFIRRVLHVRDILPDEPGPLTIPVILDGENAWEYYPDNAEAFFEALYGGLEAEQNIRTRTASEAADAATARPLPRVVAGSWIGRSLSTWIGHPEKNRAWERLTETRRAVAERKPAPSFDDPAWRAVFAGEGSDWFWWFGDDHFTPFAAEFDASFRRQLRFAWATAGLEPPEILHRPVRESAPRGFLLPQAPVAAVIDGRVTDFFEWLPAGRAGGGAGTMQSASRLVREVWFGTANGKLNLRLDPADPPASGSLGGAILTVRVPGHPDAALRVPLPPTGTVKEDDVELAVARIVEASIPIALLPRGEKGIHFQVEIETIAGESQRVPADGSLFLPDESEDPSRFDWAV